MKRRTGILLAVALALAAGAVLLPKLMGPPNPATALGRSWAAFSWRTALPARFPEAGSELDLTADETAEFFDLLTKQQKALAKASAALLSEAARNAEVRRAAQRELVRQQLANQQELLQVLGGQYESWNRYQSALLVRQQVTDLRTRLAAGANPLRDEQAARLLDLLTPAQQRLDEELRAWGTGDAAITSPDVLDEHIRRTVANQRELLGIASPHLDPPQQEEYWRVLDQIAMREVAWTRMMGKLGTAAVQIGP